MKKLILPIIALIVIIACNFLAPTAPPTEIPFEPAPILATQAPPPTQVPPPPTPMPTLEPTAVRLAMPAIDRLPEQWNGTYTYPTTGKKQNITLLIEKVNGTTFTGKMIWQSYGSSRGAILKMNGEFITDFGTGQELTKWNNLEDYKYGERNGFWLKWTETEIIDGGNYTVNGWYYAHIREDGTMVAVYFYNKDETVADIGIFVLEKVSP